MYIDKNCIEIAKGHGAESKTIFVADQENYEIDKELNRRSKEKDAKERVEKKEIGKSELEAFIKATGEDVVKNFVNAYGDSRFLERVQQEIEYFDTDKTTKREALELVLKDRVDALSHMVSAGKEMSYAGAGYLLAYNSNLGDEPVGYLCKPKSLDDIKRKTCWYVNKATVKEDNVPTILEK